jgi:hypothetical protein
LDIFPLRAPRIEEMALGEGRLTPGIRSSGRAGVRPETAGARRERDELPQGSISPESVY